MRNALGRLKNYKIKRIFRSSGVTGVQELQEFRH
jgi:hypothetical protein